MRLKTDSTYQKKSSAFHAFRGWKNEPMRTLLYGFVTLCNKTACCTSTITNPLKTRRRDFNCAPNTRYVLRNRIYNRNCYIVPS